ncbi:MAG: hypothetical protein HY821_20365 [Acidobacteria bacterium]|nr:hypothetical protein [Acidobacteriota bacterium]
MNKLTLAALAGFAFLGFLAFITWQMIGERQNRVEVCMEYHGRTDCKIASGSTRDAAVRTAGDAACSLIASGMTELMQCQHSTPKSVRPLN